MVKNYSAVGWAKEFGNDIELVPLGRLVRLRGEKNDPIRETQVLSLTADRGVILYEDKGDIGNRASEDISRYSIVRVGDIVINSMNIIIGSVGQSNYDGALSPVYYVLTPIDENKIDMRFLAFHFQMKAFQKGLIRIGYGILDHRMRIPWINLAAELIAVPPIEIQQQIVESLNSKITQLNSLLKNKEEICTRIIDGWQSQLVEAFDFPRDHIAPLKYFAWWQEGPGIMAEDFRSAGIPIMRISHVRTEPFNLDECQFVEIEMAEKKWLKYRTQLGDIIISASASTEAIATVVNSELAGSIPYTGLIRIKSSSVELDNEFLRFFLLSPTFWNQVERLKQGIGIQHWGPSHLNQVQIPIPDLEVQKDVVKALKISEFKKNSLLKLHKESVCRIIELKDSALTMAITGQNMQNRSER